MQMSPGFFQGLKKRFAYDSDLATSGIRGAGAKSQADFGDPITEEDLLWAVEREPVAHRIVFTVAHDIFDNWFTATKVKRTRDTEFDLKVQAVLSKLGAKTVFTQAAVYERLFGWSIIVLGYADYGASLAASVKDPSEIRDLAAYGGSKQVRVLSFDEDQNRNSPRYGLPNFYTLYLSQSSPVKVHYSRVIHFATRLLSHPYMGLSALAPVYDDITVLRNERWGMGQTMHRYGGGFPDIELQGADKRKLDEFEASNQFESLNARNYFLHNEKQKVEFKGLQGQALNPEPYYTPVMENISAGCGIPLAILRGAQAGALTGSDVNEREYFKVISDNQSRFEPGVRQLIDALIETGQIPKVPAYEIEWSGGFEVNQIDRSNIELNKARSLALCENFMKVNELRARMDPPLDPLKSPDDQPDPDGDIIPGLLRLKQAAFSQMVKEVQK